MKDQTFRFRFARAGLAGLRRVISSARVVVSASAVAVAGAASAAGTTQTLTYQVGTAGTQFNATFSWTVTNVLSKGTFADGTPWITVAPGAQLIAVSPVSQRRTTSAGFMVVTNGSAKNPRMQFYVDPQTLGAVSVGKQLFDQRRIFLSPPANQLAIDSTFDFAANIGMPSPSTGQIAPVPLAAGDVVVTAKSRWVDTQPGTWGAGGNLPHCDAGRRTAIDRFGVLTVLPSAPASLSFRPPMQWRPGYEASRPAPIPVSSVITNESALLHSGIGTYSAIDQLLASPNFHDGHGVLYQSSQAQYAVSSDPTLQDGIVYGGTQAKTVLQQALFAATDSSLPAATRVLARNRLIQVGIDSYGAAMSLGDTKAGAGQRAAEMKPWILLAGWWLNRTELRRPYDSIRAFYPGTSVVALTDVQLGKLIFHDDHVASQVKSGIGLGAPYHQVWGPGQTYHVTGAAIATSAALMDSGTVFGQFGRINIDGAFQHPEMHARHPDRYFGCSLRIEGGAGAGSTVYRVLQVGNVNGGIGSFVIVDRPWQTGTPGPTSVVRMFPFRNGDFTPGLTTDVGRWYYSTQGQNSQPGIDCLSPVANGYARVSFKALVAPYSALKRLADVTGDKSYILGSTWNWLAEAIGGTGNSLVSGQLQGAAPNSERLSNQIWSAFRHATLRTAELQVVKGWLGDDGTPAGFGYIDRTRIPGASVATSVPMSMTPCSSAVALSPGMHAVETSPGEDLALSASSIIHSVGWYSYTPLQAGPVQVDTRMGSAFDTRLAIVSNCDASVLFGFNDNVSGSDSSSSVTFNAAAGTTYMIAVGGTAPDQYGTVMLTISGSGSSGSSGGDDDDDDDDDEGDDEGDDDVGDLFGQDDGAGYSPCEFAMQVGEGATPIAIAQAADFDLMGGCSGGPGGFSKIRNPSLLRFVPTQGGIYVASTCGGTLLDTRMVVIAGCNAGDVLACNDDAPGCNGASEVAFEAMAGVEYLIVVGTEDREETGAALVSLERLTGEQAPRRMLMAVGVTSLPGANGPITGIKTHDLVLRDESTGKWSMYFDGSDVGLGSFAIDAVAALPDGSLVMSFDKEVSIPGLAGGPSGTSVNRCDLVKFIPSSTGWTTAGQWQFWFDGSDVGLDQTNEDIDAVEVLEDGSLIISVKTKVTAGPLVDVPGSSVIRFIPASLGAATSGTWMLYIDGPDVSLSTGSENIDAISVGPGGRISLSTASTFSVPGVNGGGADVFDFFPLTLGSFTSGNFASHFLGAAHGIPNGKLNALTELPTP